MAKRTVVGDIVLIPLAEGFRPAKVLYVSRWFKNVILLGVYGDSIAVQEMPGNLSDAFELQLYTSKAPIRSQRWHHVGNEPLRACQTDLDLRIVAAELWKGDEHLGPASEDDKRNLPKMLVVGAGLVEKWAAEL